MALEQWGGLEKRSGEGPPLGGASASPAGVDCHPRPQQMEFLGRHIARKLNINYFDCLETSYRHVVRHWPLEVAFGPGIVKRKTRDYDKTGSQSDLNV